MTWPARYNKKFNKYLALRRSFTAACKAVALDRFRDLLTVHFFEGELVDYERKFLASRGLAVAVIADSVVPRACGHGRRRRVRSIGCGDLSNGLTRSDFHFSHVDQPLPHGRPRRTRCRLRFHR